MSNLPRSETGADTRGRSLWNDALARLSGNRLAKFSGIWLILMALACIFGPMLLPHDFSTIYKDYTRIPPSLSAYPKTEAVGPAVDVAVRRARLALESWERDGEHIKIHVSSDAPIDPRVTRYFERSDLFTKVELTQVAADAMSATLIASIDQNWFLFGTDSNGRDLLARTLVAGRVSLSIGLLAGLVAVAIGVLYGATAGFVGGRVDELMMRLVDILYSLPFIFMVIMLMVFFGRNFVLMFVAVGAILWLDMARIVRGQTLSIRRQEFVQAAEALGVRPGAIILRHVVPNVLGPVAVYMTLLVPQVIILESFLSFLGMGVQEPMASWGVLIANGAKSIGSANWLLLFPAAFLISTLSALNFLGDGLRDALDPKDR